MPESILKDVGKIIDEALGLKGRKIGKAPHYRHRESCLMLCKEPVSKFDGGKLIKDIYEKIGSNWRERKYLKSPSCENWRLIPNPSKKDKAKEGNRKNKLEVRLERAIVDMFARDRSDAQNWANQVPTASGFVGPRTDKRGAIDLVHRLGDGAYELIELKVHASGGTPLYAAMEILQYGALYIFARRKEQIKSAANEKRLLQAKSIHLKVLAPCDYYNGCKLDWLEDEINSGLKRYLAAQTFDFDLDFKFEAFPPGFSLKPFPEYGAIAQALNDRRFVVQQKLK